MILTPAEARLYICCVDRLRNCESSDYMAWVRWLKPIKSEVRSIAPVILRYEETDMGYCGRSAP